MNYESKDPKSEKKQVKKVFALQGLNTLHGEALGQ